MEGRIKELQERRKRLVTQHSELDAMVKECDALMNELAERHTRQREARVIYVSEMLKIKNEVEAIDKELDKLTDKVLADQVESPNEA